MIRMGTFYRWLVLAVAATAVVAFIAGAALMGDYASDQQAAPPQHGGQSRPAEKGLVEDVPGVGKAARTASEPVARPLCKGAVKAQETPVVGQVIVFIVDGIARGVGAGGC